MKLYNVKVKVTIEVTGKKGGTSEKIISELYNVWAETVSDAETKTHEYFKGTMQDFEVVSSTETKVIDVIGSK